MDTQIVIHPTNPSWLTRHNSGRFFMVGPGDPEDFLYRGTRNVDGTRTGDQMTLINKMIGTGANCIYMQSIRSHGGDGQVDHNPFVDPVNDKSINDDIFDQWETWFTKMDENGIVVYLFIYDDAIKVSTNLGWSMSNGNLHSEEEAYIEGIVKKFKHHKNLIWCIMEEVQEMGSDYLSHSKKIAERIKYYDDQDHVVAVHMLSGLNFDDYENDPNIDQFAIQYNANSVSVIHDDVANLFTTKSDGKYNLNFAECAFQMNSERAIKRQISWAVALAGAYVMQYGTDIASNTIAELEDCGRIVSFMESTNFDEMKPADSLAHGGTEYVLAKGKENYIAYSSDTTNIGIKSVEVGTYKLVWFDAVSGEKVEECLDVDQAGDQTWNKPSKIDNELAVYISKVTTCTENSNVIWYVMIPSSILLACILISVIVIIILAITLKKKKENLPDNIKLKLKSDYDNCN